MSDSPAQKIDERIAVIDQEFAAVFGCGPSAGTRKGDDTVLTYGRCTGGVVVRDIRVAGLAHHWPLREFDGYDMGPVMWRLAFG